MRLESDSRATWLAAAIVVIGATGCGSSDERAAANPELEYRRALWLVGLEEEVTVVKTPLSVYAVRADGSRASFVRLLDADAQAYRDRFGAGSPRLELRLAQAAPEESLPVSIQIIVPGLEAIVASPEAGRAKRLEQAMAGTVEPVGAWLAEHGFVERRRSGSMPILFGAMPAAAIPSIVHDDRLAMVSVDEVRVIERDGEYAVDPVETEHSIDSTWNPTPGDYAADVPGRHDRVVRVRSPSRPARHL